MDQIHDVEVFRTMLIQKGVVAADGSEAILTDILCSDESAVNHFMDHYFTQPQGWEEKARRMAYSALERNDMLSRDLMLLCLWAQYLDSLHHVGGAALVAEKLNQFGFSDWRRFEHQVIRESVSYARSKATAKSCDKRGKNSGKIPTLLRLPAVPRFNRPLTPELQKELYELLMNMKQGMQ